MEAAEKAVRWNISMRPSVMAKADAAAALMGLSRSAWIALAIQDYYGDTRNALRLNATLDEIRASRQQEGEDQ